MVIMKKMDMLTVGRLNFYRIRQRNIIRFFFRECYMSSFVPKCLGCKQTIIDTYIQALGGHYHKNCFVCQVNINSRAKDTLLCGDWMSNSNSW